MGWDVCFLSNYWVEDESLILFSIYNKSALIFYVFKFIIARQWISSFTSNFFARNRLARVEWILWCAEFLSSSVLGKVSRMWERLSTILFSLQTWCRYWSFPSLQPPVPRLAIRRMDIFHAFLPRRAPRNRHGAALKRGHLGDRYTSAAMLPWLPIIVTLRQPGDHLMSWRHRVRWRSGRTTTWLTRRLPDGAYTSTFGQKTARTWPL